MTIPPVGNLTDKRNHANPLFRRLQARLDSAVVALAVAADDGKILDFGCGEGELSTQLAQACPARSVVGLDLDDPKLRADWARIAQPNLDFVGSSSPRLPFDDGEFEVVVAMEVLEHIPDWSGALHELRRVCRGHLIASVPREPIWRGLNMARFKYVRDWGNTPGHVNHWSGRGFGRAISSHAELLTRTSIFPWTLVLARPPAKSAP